MIGKRLKRAREAAGMSLRDLEATIEGLVTAQAIGKYERDEMMPGSTVLIALAKALDVTVEYLLRTEEVALSGVDFRKAPKAGVKEEKAVEAAVLDEVERYLAVEDLFPGQANRWHAPTLRELHLATVDAAERAAQALRNAWSLGIDPIPIMAELLEDKGVKVISLELPQQVSGSKAFVHRGEHDGIPVVVVNAGHNGERQRLTMAHELAHLVLQFDGMSAAEEEKAADWFAGAFLVAGEMLARVLGKHRTAIALGELAELKKIFKVSVACLLMRCTQLGIITKAMAGRLWGQISRLGWNGPNSTEPNTFPAERPERMERLCLRAVAEGALSESKAAELLKISVRALDHKLNLLPA